MSRQPLQQQPKIFTIPATTSFVDSLAAGLFNDVKGAQEQLATYLILLPTRRACRSLQEAFLRLSDKPMLLPRLQPFGDIDADELSIAGQGSLDIDIPPAMPPLKRQILLAQTISKLPDFTRGPEQDIALAQALGQLMDRIHTENLNLSDLPNIVDRDSFAEHWQITVDFLSILSEHWPHVLEEYGMIDATDRRNRLMLTLNRHWQKTPPAYPVIAAGSTGSIPATAALLKTISVLPKGSVILPGLDQSLTNDIWNEIGEGHPQATLKHLLNSLEIERQDIKIWPHVKNQSDSKLAREKLISNTMVPAEKTDIWQTDNPSTKEKEEIKNSLKNIKRYDCKTPQEEAQLISLLLRETLETKSKIGALVTPDRNLARRAAMACRRWNIEIDDSGGQSLNNSPTGLFLRLSAKAAIEQLSPVSLLAFLKHELNTGGNFDNYRRTVRQLERSVLRGQKPAPGFQGLLDHIQKKIDDPKNNHKPSDEVLSFITHLQKIFSGFVTSMSDGYHAFSTLLEEHIRICENLSGHAEDKNSFLWQGDSGEAVAQFLTELREHTHSLPDVRGIDYLAILTQFMGTVTTRPRYGTHPRLMILGQLEARLIQADRVIMAGLNEGTWPPDPGHDPWMSRPMRQNFGLPAPERSISLAAHDFVQGFCADEVFLTRSERIDGAPTVSARWLSRLDTYLTATGIDKNIIRNGPHLSYLQHLDHAQNIMPLERPKPKPAIADRPTQLSVTKIEKWLKDPYTIYAQEILKLKKLDPLEKPIGASERGIIIHAIMERFMKAHPKKLPMNAYNDFIDIAKDVLTQKTNDLADYNFWMPRLIAIGEWLIEDKANWREKAQFLKAEAEGKIVIKDNVKAPFTLIARADRIDTLNDGSLAIIDYKSGGTYSGARIESGDLPQLPLEAMMLTEGGFAEDGIQKNSIGSLSYWKLTGKANEAGEITQISKPQQLQNSLDNAQNGLINLIKSFENPETPYMAIPRLDNAPRFNNYEYLERVKEWAALGENSEEAA